MLRATRHAARLAVVTAALIGAPFAVLAQSPTAARKILVVHSYPSFTPGIELLNQGFVDGMRAAPPDSVDFYIEHLDLPRLGGGGGASLLASQLREKYKGQDLRVIVAMTDSALAFLRTYDLFQDVPTVAYTEEGPPADALNVEPNVVRVWAGPAAAETVALAMRLHPSTKHLVVLSGQPDNDGEYEQTVRAQLTDLPGDVDVTYLTDQSLEKGLVAVRTLPPQTVVLMLRNIEARPANREARENGVALSNASTAPFYAMTDTRVGYGAVGGYVRDTVAAGSQVAALAVRVALGARPRDLQSEKVRVSPMFDWRQLQRWGISESQLPAGSTILYKQASAWELYRRQIIGASLFVLLQSALIATLLVQRRRRMRVERALRESDTDRKASEDALREGQTRYRLATAAGAVGVWDWNFATSEVYVDPTLKAILGFPATDTMLRADDWGSRIHPDDLARVTATVEACVNGSTDDYEVEHRMIPKAGGTRWFLSRGTLLRGTDGRAHRMVGTKVDITARKGAEEAVRERDATLRVTDQEIRYLAGRLILAQEVERARISRDLHDDIGQHLAALSISLSSVKRRVGLTTGDDSLQADMSSLQSRTAALAENVRQISHDLHPAMLEHTDLVAALAAHCSEVQRQRSITVTFAAQGDFTGVDRDNALCMYRITQEALRNVVTHAAAPRADVLLVRTEDVAELTIIDDGKGFDTGSSGVTQGLGLTSIYERVRLAGGTVSITSAVHKGTCVRVHIPIDKQARRNHASGAGGSIRV